MWPGCRSPINSCSWPKVSTHSGVRLKTRKITRSLDSRFCAETVAHYCLYHLHITAIETVRLCKPLCEVSKSDEVKIRDKWVISRDARDNTPKSGTVPWNSGRLVILPNRWDLDHPRSWITKNNLTKYWQYLTSCKTKWSPSTSQQYRVSQCCVTRRKTWV